MAMIHLLTVYGSMLYIHNAARRKHSTQMLPHTPFHFLLAARACWMVTSGCSMQHISLNNFSWKLVLEKSMVNPLESHYHDERIKVPI